MMPKEFVRPAGFKTLVGMAALLVAGFTMPLLSVTVKEAQDMLDHLAFSRPELTVTASHESLDSIRTESGNKLSGAFEAFLERRGGTWRLVADRLTGTPALIEGSGLPWIPGSGNGLSREELGFSGQGAPLSTVENLAFDLIRENPDLFPARVEDLVLMEDASGPRGNYLYFVNFSWTYQGIPVENATLSFRLNHGNLVQIGQERISSGIGSLDVTPAIDIQTAWQIVWGYAGRTGSEEVLEPGILRILPFSAREVIEGRSVPVGSGLGYHLAYVMSFRRSGVIGTWEARVDAHTGEILSFLDTNRYGSVHGAVYAIDGQPAETDRPLVYADLGNGEYADGSGYFPGFEATSNLNGEYVRIWDACGSIEHSTTDGDLDFGQSPDNDCSTPGFGGEGNTRAARTQYYHINLVKERVRTYLPQNTWLDRRLTDNVNLSGSCNAWWDGRNVNFLQSSGYCGNTGELPGVSLHEWGHGLDQNDGNGSSPELGTAETYGDFTAVLQSHNSCAGPGFFKGNCDGYGDPCNSCTGVREIDYKKHRSRNPATTESFTKTYCPNTSGYFGPCLKEGHCESAVSSQALWDLATLDLPEAGMDQASAWQLMDRLWYLSRSIAGAAFTCDPTTFESDGCGGESLFNAFRLVDDCDGDLSNGTPHAGAIFSAFDRHGITCPDAVNTVQANCCPDLQAPVLQATLAIDGVDLTWTPVAGAERYRIWRNENSCDNGNVLLHSLDAPGDTFLDDKVVWGMTYRYRVQALADSDACEGPVTECATVELPSHPGIHHFSHTLEDACANGGAGNLNGTIDPGERIQIALTAGNTSPENLTNIQAEVSVSSPEVTVADPFVPFPDMNAGFSAQGMEPLVLDIDPAFLCDEDITVVLLFTSDQGTWEDAFQLQVGDHYAQEKGAALMESFSTWPPAGWTIVNLGGDCAWRTSTQTGRTNGTGGTGPAAIADSDFCGDATAMHTALVSPYFALDNPMYDDVVLNYYHLFRDYYGTTRAYVEISEDGKDTWRILEALEPGNVGSGYGLRTLDLSGYRGKAGLRIRFRYEASKQEEWWEVDDVEVAYTINPYCLVEGCDTGFPLTITADADKDLGVVPVPVHFEGRPEGGMPPYTYAWDFGDGSLAFGRYVSHTYETPGTYTWLLTVTDGNGGNDSASGGFTAKEPCGWTCAVLLDPAGGDVPLEVAFTSLDTAAACGLTPEYLWDFGDGVTSTEVAPVHLYNTAGIYPWTLTVTADGEVCTGTGIIEAEEPCGLTCSAAASPDEGEMPLEIIFDSTVVASNCAGEPAYSWDFGDGGSSIEARPTYTYAVPGSYTWRLDVTIEDQVCTAAGSVNVLPVIPGDCDGNGSVSIGEVQGATNMFLGVQPPACGADCDDSGSVSIGELQRVINAFLGFEVAC